MEVDCHHLQLFLNKLIGRLGNFQAKAVTSAMEKTRLSLQSIGQMLFAQCTELINPAMNRGLPPNLVGGEPSQSFIWKGTDIMIAALQAELGFLANPVGSVSTFEFLSPFLYPLKSIDELHDHDMMTARRIR